MSKATSKDNNTGVPQGRKPEDEMRGLEPSAPTENSLRCANCPKEGMTRKEYVEHWNRNHGSGEVTQTDSSVDEYQAQAESLTEQWMETLAPLDKVCVASHGRLDVMIADALRASYADERLEACRLVGEQDPEMVYGTHAAIQRLGEELHRLASTAPAVRQLTDDDVEWVVNDIAELGVKIGDQFFFLYKAHSYKGGHHWRYVYKREFGECCHPWFTIKQKSGLERLPDSYVGFLGEDIREWSPLHREKEDLDETHREECPICSARPDKKDTV